MTPAEIIARAVASLFDSSQHRNKIDPHVPVCYSMRVPTTEN